MLVLAIPEHLLQIFTHYSAVAEMGASYMVYRSPCLLIYSVVLPLVMALKSTQHVKLPVFASCAAILSNIELHSDFWQVWIYCNGSRRSRVSDDYIVID